MDNVEVFKTNIIQQNDAIALLEILYKICPKHKINFDLEDCDKILRVEGIDINAGQIILFLESNGFQCTVLV